MSFKKTILAAAVLALSFAAEGGTAQASVNLITNGDFSNPNQSGGWNIYTPGVAGWTNVSGDGVEIGNSNIYGLSCQNAGCQNLEVNANTFGAVQQVVSGLTVGAYYDLSFLYGARNSGGPDTLNVYFGATPPSASSLLTVDFDTTTGNSGLNSWTLNNFRLQATATSETLYFQSGITSGIPSYGNEITNVALAAVPEPSTWAMLLLGFGAIGWALRSRRDERAFSA